MDNRTFADKVSDKVAEVGGSWTFVIGCVFAMALWIGCNIFFLTHPFDPFPFVLLNLVLSTIAALQAPIIMMSQNRKAEADRHRDDRHYQISKKAETRAEEAIELLKEINQKLDKGFRDRL